MEGKIDVKGNLLLKRGKSFKEVYCPYSNRYPFCSDNCALFGEPHTKNLLNKYEINLCYKTCYFDTFVDERG